MEQCQACFVYYGALRSHLQVRHELSPEQADDCISRVEIPTPQSVTFTLSRLDEAEAEAEAEEKAEEVGLYILDTETTGLGKEDVIIEISVFDMIQRRTFTRLVSPNGQKNWAENVNNISQAALATAPSWSTVYDELLEWMGEKKTHIIYAHNAHFDHRMFSQTCEKARIEEPNKSFLWVCSLAFF